jgi:hypothetical protein
MIYFNPNPSAPGTEYYDILIENEPLLTIQRLTEEQKQKLLQHHGRAFIVDA